MQSKVLKSIFAYSAVFRQCWAPVQLDSFQGILYHFQHITSSPRYPQSNGLAERTVKTVKFLFIGTSDPHLALHSYRAIPLPWCLISPVELLFGRKIATNLPQLDVHLLPYLKAFQQTDSAHKSKQQTQFNRRHRTRSLPELPACTSVGEDR